MQCNDCGGTLAVKGTQDDPEITCNHCDPRGPVDKTPKPNTVYFRMAHIEIKVDTKWLTADGECDIVDSWNDLQERITRAVQGIFAGQYKFPVNPQLEWGGWDGEPEAPYA